MKKNNKAFTLVELAIVITIIGLLIGGVLKGQELIENARIKSVISQVRGYQTAYTTFRDIYKAKPGDMAEARSFLQNCSTSANCVNGNGDSSVGPATANNYSGDYGLTDENTQFWRHLALANLISGINPQATTVDWNVSNPASPLGGGFTLKETIAGGDPSNFPGLALRLHAQVIGNVSSIIENAPTLSPFQIWQIDSTMDDGMPFSGSVRSSGAGGAVPPCETSYTPADHAKACTGYFILE